MNPPTNGATNGPAYPPSGSGQPTLDDGSVMNQAATLTESAVPHPSQQVYSAGNEALNGETQTISADEIALYDRQIRLWGVKAQERLRSAKILLIGMKALANEIAKNLVLAGVGSLTILDHEQIGRASCRERV